MTFKLLRFIWTLYYTFEGLPRKPDDCDAVFEPGLSMMSSVDPMSSLSGLAGNAPKLVLEVPALRPLLGGA